MTDYRTNFPFFARNPEIVYLDAAATAQKPQAVLDAMHEFYLTATANIHRGSSTLGARATEAYESARQKVADFIHAHDPREVVFTRGTTDGINMLAQTWGRANIKRGDCVLVSIMEHHSNFLPWQQLCADVGAELLVAPITPAGELDMPAFEKLLERKPKLVALTHVSNTLGTTNPLADIAMKVHHVGGKLLVDGAQAISHMLVDVNALVCDFYTFSAHKVYGPTGIGVLWARAELLNEMKPYQVGGGMVAGVSVESFAAADIPQRFEAGTPAIAEAVGLGAALDWILQIGWNEIQNHEHELLRAATAGLEQIDGVRIIGTAPEKAAVISFLLEGAHAADLAAMLDQQHIAIRAGTHCTEPLLKTLDIDATCRASFGLWNTMEDIEKLVAATKKAKQLLT